MHFRAVVFHIRERVGMAAWHYFIKLSVAACVRLGAGGCTGGAWAETWSSGGAARCGWVPHRACCSVPACLPSMEGQPGGGEHAIKPSGPALCLQQLLACPSHAFACLCNRLALVLRCPASRDV
jgi:hypothetical protein